MILSLNCDTMTHPKEPFVSQADILISVSPFKG